MCGIFAIIPAANANKESIRIAMLMLAQENTARGKQSWGLWSRDGEIVKGFGGPIEGSSRGEFIKTLRLWDPTEGSWMAGHTRFATHGAVTKDNQHPFTKGGITLAHNGVVDVEGYDDKSHIVDSGRILASIVDHGYEKGIKNVSGTCGLLVSVQGELYAYRSNQTLHMAHGEWGYAVSSAKEHLKAALEAADLAVEGDISPIDESYLMSPWGPREVHLHCPTSGTANRAPRTFYGSCGDTTSYGGRSYEGYDRDGVYYSNGYRNASDYGVKIVGGRKTTYKTCDVCGEKMMFEDVYSEFELDNEVFDLFLESRLNKIQRPHIYKTYDVCDQCAYKARSLTIFDMLLPVRLSGAMTAHHMKRPLVGINQVRLSTLSKGLKSSSNQKFPLTGYIPSLIRLEFAVDEELDGDAILANKSLYGGHNDVETSATRRSRRKDRNKAGASVSNVTQLTLSCKQSQQDAAGSSTNGTTATKDASEPNPESAAAVGKHILITEQDLARIGSASGTSKMVQ